MKCQTPEKGGFCHPLLKMLILVHPSGVPFSEIRNAVYTPLLGEVEPKWVQGSLWSMPSLQDCAC